MELNPDGYVSIDGAVGHPEIPAVLKGLAARQLSDGRWCVIDRGDQRGPTADELTALEALALAAPAAVKAEKDIAAAKKEAGEAMAAAGVEPTESEVLLRVLVKRLGEPTEKELDDARAELVAEAGAKP